MKQNNQVKLERVKCQFEKWRLNRSSRKERIPDSLWEQAVELCSNFSVHTVCRTLRLNFNDLKRRLEKTLLPSPSLLSPQDFVEVSLPILPPFQRVSFGPQFSCERIEIERKDGSRMRLYAKPSQSLDALALITVFLGGRHASTQP